MTPRQLRSSITKASPAAWPLSKLASSSTEGVRTWFDGMHPIVIVEAGDAVITFAATSAYRSRECYAGIAEVSV